MALLIAGLCLFAPGWWSDLIAMAIALPALYIHWVKHRQFKLE